ncbi:MAG: PilZ domain-containing protein [Deltaproteobacteria bacterium]|nr:PilZ domain-containing protein [Deltaproteobacteria bacterium]
MASGKKEQPEDQYVLLRSDRRKNLRKQLLVLKIRGEDNRGVFFGYAKTISRGGMFISSVNPRKMGEEFEITFKLDEKQGREIKCRAVVVWIREYDSLVKQEPGMGKKFMDLDDAIRDEIDEWIGSR